MLGRELLSARDVTIWGINVCDDAAYLQREVRHLLEETNDQFQLGLSVAMLKRQQASAIIAARNKIVGRCWHGA